MAARRARKPLVGPVRKVLWAIMTLILIGLCAWAIDVWELDAGVLGQYALASVVFVFALAIPALLVVAVVKLLAPRRAAQDPAAASSSDSVKR